MEKKVYDIVYSLGYDCTCARYMAKYHLRSYAGPFDWITLCDYKTRMEYILNDFENFLNKEDLEFIPRPPEKDYLNPKMIDFVNKRDKFEFYHDFPKGKTLDESFPEIKAKYDRRIKRFDEKLKTEKNILLLWLSHEVKVSNEELLKYSEKIMAKYGKKIDFIYLENDKTKGKGEVEKEEISPHIIKYKLRTVDPKVKGKIPLTAEACDKIFKGLHSRGQTKRMLADIGHRFWVKGLSLLILYRPWRKAFKQRFYKI